jgi:hypothetical protein
MFLWASKIEILRKLTAVIFHFREKVNTGNSLNFAAYYSTLLTKNNLCYQIS